MDDFTSFFQKVATIVNIRISTVEKYWGIWPVLRGNLQKFQTTFQFEIHRNHRWKWILNKREFQHKVRLSRINPPSLNLCQNIQLTRWPLPGRTSTGHLWIDWGESPWAEQTISWGRPCICRADKWWMIITGGTWLSYLVSSWADMVRTEDTLSTGVAWSHLESTTELSADNRSNQLQQQITRSRQSSPVQSSPV